MVIRCVLFDADGVVIRSKKFSHLYQKKFNVHIDNITPFFKEEFKECLVGKADLVKSVKPWLLKWNWDKSPEDFLKFWFNAENKVNIQIIKLIRKLKESGVKCYLATNQEKYRIRYMRKEMGFDKIFDGVFSSAEIGYRKPDANFYKFILNELKLRENFSPEEILFFDDTEKHVLEAKKLGIESYVYKNFNSLKSVINSKI